MKSILRLIKIFSARIILVLPVIYLFLQSPLRAQTFTFDGDREKDVMDFQLIKNLIVIPLYINGKGPYNFVLDTGVSPMIISDPTIIDSLSLGQLRVTKLSGLGAGNDVEAYLTDQIYVRIGHSTISNIPTAILKEDLFNLSSYLGTRIYGLIGYYFFNSFVVKIKYPAKRLSFSLPETRVKKKGERIPLEMISNKPYIKATINPAGLEPFEAKLILDIGASHAISMESYRDKPFPLPAKTITANLGVGFTGLISGHIGRISSLKIGSTQFDNVLSSFPYYEEAAAKTMLKERNGNLGSNVMKHFDITFDYPDFCVYLKPNKYYKRTFEHDMAGMEVYIEEGKPSHYLVGRIEPGSPAEEADFHSQDELLSINFKLIQEYSLDDIDLLLKSGNGRHLIIEIGRGKERLYKLVILRRRV
jgi:hypothetical protein